MTKVLVAPIWIVTPSSVSSPLSVGMIEPKTRLSAKVRSRVATAVDASLGL